MLHLIWYLIVGSVVAGFLTHFFTRPRGDSSFHPAGIIFSIPGAFLVLFLWTKLNVLV